MGAVYLVWGANKVDNPLICGHAVSMLISLECMRMWTNKKFMIFQGGVCMQ